MRNFNIQILSAMMALVVYTARHSCYRVTTTTQLPKNQTLLLEQIINEAKEMRDHHKTQGVLEIQFPSHVAGKCWKKFFCQAEKGLNETVLKTSNLTRMLTKYNNGIEPKINCSLVNGRVNISHFLNDTMDCAKYVLHSHRK